MLQYKVGQLYMIAKHSHEQSEAGEGVEVLENKPVEDPVHGKGQYTEKRIHLNKLVHVESNVKVFSLARVCEIIEFMSHLVWNWCW